MKNSLSRALGGKHPKVISNRPLKQLKPRLTRRGHMSVREKVTGNICDRSMTEKPVLLNRAPTKSHKGRNWSTGVDVQKSCFLYGQL